MRGHCKASQRPDVSFPVSPRDKEGRKHVQFTNSVVQILVLQLYTLRQDGLSLGCEFFERRCEVGLVGCLRLEVLSVEG